MGAVRLLVSSELRRRWRSLAVTALLVGLTGAVTLAAVGGARRTSSSFDRFLESTRSHDVQRVNRRRPRSPRGRRSVRLPAMPAAAEPQGAAAPADPVALLRSRSYLVLLGFGALIGVPVATIASAS